MNNLVIKEQLLNDDQAVLRLQKLAEIMATARITVPEGIRGNMGDCFMICVQAAAWDISPFAVAQKTFVVKGKIGYEAQLISAVISRHALQDKPRFDYSEGWEKVLGKFTIAKNNGKEHTVIGWKPQDEDGLYVDISATLNGESEPRSLRVYLNQAHPRQSSIWATDPKQQLAYTAIKKFARLHCPECILGVQDRDDIAAIVEKDITPADKLSAALQGEKLTARAESEQPPGRAETGRCIAYTQEPTSSVIEAAPVDVVDENKGEAMKQRVRENMRENNQSVEPAPSRQDETDRDMFLDIFKNCLDLTQLEEAGNTMAGRIHPEFVNQLKDAYKQRRNELSDVNQSE